MDFIKEKLSSLLATAGGVLALAGVLSIVVQLIGFEVKLLFWINTWGFSAAWGIRIALIVIGIIFLIASSLMGSSNE